VGAMNYMLVLPVGIVVIIILIALFFAGSRNDERKHKDDWKDHLKK
jgi:peptidoglycan biosynthesis protein MviN/MurJ (putative lipid II flippase)